MQELARDPLNPAALFFNPNKITFITKIVNEKIRNQGYLVLRFSCHFYYITLILFSPVGTICL